jgi:PAS domain S-box-containing protein
MPDRCPLGVLEAIHLKVVEALPDAAVAINSEGEIIVFNTEAEFMFGYVRDEVLGRKIEILLPQNLREQHSKHREGWFEQPTTREMGTGQVLHGLNKAGKTFPVQIKLARIIIPETGVHGLAIIRRTK